MTEATLRKIIKVEIDGVRGEMRTVRDEMRNEFQKELLKNNEIIFAEFDRHTGMLKEEFLSQMKVIVDNHECRLNRAGL